MAGQPESPQCVWEGERQRGRRVEEMESAREANKAGKPGSRTDRHRPEDARDSPAEMTARERQEEAGRPSEEGPRTTGEKEGETGGKVGGSWVRRVQPPGSAPLSVRREDTQQMGVGGSRPRPRPHPALPATCGVKGDFPRPQGQEAEEPGLLRKDA